MAQKGFIHYDAVKYLWEKINESSSDNPTIRNAAEQELDKLPHSAKSFGKLVKNIMRDGYNVTCPVVLDGKGGTLDGSHRLFAMQFLVDKVLFLNNTFISFVRPSEEDIENGNEL